MATDLTTIFGSEINVQAQPANVDRQYVGFPGGNGLLSMNLGTRGRQLVIAGTLAATGSGYADARSNLQAIIDNLESYLTAPEADYSFAGTTFLNVVFDRFQLIPDSNKVFHYTAEGYVTCRFICYGRSLL